MDDELVRARVFARVDLECVRLRYETAAVQLDRRPCKVIAEYDVFVCQALL